jgi:hypothetical protein
LNDDDDDKYSEVNAERTDQVNFILEEGIL